MIFRWISALTVVLGLSLYIYWAPLTQWFEKQFVSQPMQAELYRWKDARGNIVYGTTPPPAPIKAEKVDQDKNAISVVPATKMPPKKLPTVKDMLDDDKNAERQKLRDKMMDRAIDPTSK